MAAKNSEMQVASVYWSSRNIFTPLSAPNQSYKSRLFNPEVVEVKAVVINNNTKDVKTTDCAAVLTVEC